MKRRTVLKPGAILAVNCKNAPPMVRKVVDIRTTPDGFELICIGVGRKPSERRWAKSKRPEHQ